LLAAIESLPPPEPGSPARSPSPPASLAALFQQHHARVFRTALRITGNATDAEDVLQTVFLRLAKREEAVDLAPGAGSYLNRAAVNAALDLLRARKRARRVDLEDVEAELPAADEASPEGRRSSQELAGWLRSAVSRLSPRAAEIFSLRYLEGHGNSEIAEMLGTSQTAVAVILHRTRHRLAKDLAPLVGGLAS
jgi:RNA polymerase sigma-70 factor (ECF subfamily)